PSRGCRRASSACLLAALSIRAARSGSTGASPSGRRSIRSTTVARRPASTRASLPAARRWPDGGIDRLAEGRGPQEDLLDLGRDILTPAHTDRARGYFVLRARG